MTTTDRIANAPAAPTRAGHGVGIGHVGEVWQGETDWNTEWHRALLTLPCSELFSSATFAPDPTARGVEVCPPGKSKAARACALVLRRLGRDAGGELIVRSNIPERWGCGSSTADVVATIIATADAFEIRLTSDEIARLAVETETASDGTVFGGTDAVLFAHREAIVIERLGRYPPLLAAAANVDPAGVDTLQFKPAEYNEDERRQHKVLVSGLRRGSRTHDARLIGQVASGSARLNERFLPKRLDRFEHVCNAVGGVGVAVAHSGTTVAILVDAADPHAARRCRDALAELTLLGVEPIGALSIGD